MITGIVISVGQPALNQTTTTTTTITPTTTTTTEAPIPDALELSGTTTESTTGKYYWKDYQLLGLYNREGMRNGAPYYKRARKAFILGDIYFFFIPSRPDGNWVTSGKSAWAVGNEKAFNDTWFGWLWKESPG